MDVGGTGIRAGLVEEGRLIEETQAPLANRSVEAVLRVAADLVKSLGPTTAVGVALPGFASEGRIHSSPNFTGWSDVPFANLLRAQVDVPVHVENDASSAAWGTYRSGEASEDLVLFTLGTGVGGGIVSGGRLLTGSVGCGAELGHLYVGGDAQCGCGATGCLEAWASTTGLIRQAKVRGVELEDGRALWRACGAGEGWALGLAEEAGAALGRGMASISNAVNPSELHLTGGLVAGKEHLEAAVSAAFEAHCISTARKAVEVKWAGRADKAAILGVADLASSL